MTPRLRAHDLVRVDEAALLAAHMPSWVRDAISAAPWVVVRRAAAPHGQVAAGVRGPQRSQRFGFLLSEQLSRDVRQPRDLAHQVSDDGDHAPALVALSAIATAFDASGSPWGPGGSVGFELATGQRTVTPASDLDLIVRWEPSAPLDRLALAPLIEACRSACARVDCQVDIGGRGFALQELASGAPRVLARTLAGPELVDSPVGDAIRS
jgi:phosphoribosyl-dephospho-CoA transferase